ncbi:hypothetical protein BaRGS_00029069, partial [Batillaria attramentaria]
SVDSTGTERKAGKPAEDKRLEGGRVSSYCLQSAVLTVSVLLVKETTELSLRHITLTVWGIALSMAWAWKRTEDDRRASRCKGHQRFTQEHPAGFSLRACSPSYRKRTSIILGELVRMMSLPWIIDCWIVGTSPAPSMTRLHDEGPFEVIIRPVIEENERPRKSDRL